MIKPIHFIFITFIIISCKGKLDTSASIDDILLKDATTQEIVRPLLPEHLETLKDSIKLYYSKLNNYEIWYSLKNRTDLINEIKNCNKEGLNPTDYNLETILDLEEKRKKLNDDEVIKYDIILTKSFEKLAFHLYRGKLNPNKLYKDWDLTFKSIALSHLLENAIKNKTVDKTLEELKPNHYLYSKIKESLIVIDQYPDYKFEKNNIKDKIQLHDTLNEIITIKKKLAYWKDYTRKDSITTAIYDTITFLAVKKFQSRHGLKADGVIGKGTIKALNYTKEERKQQIIANLERWKWFPSNFGEEYLLVNLPDYNIVYVKKTDTLAQHNIVVGTPKRNTPVLTSKLSNLVFNPTWTVPPTIIKEDLTPSAKKNLEYFKRTRLTIYNSAGKVIAPEEWNPDNSKSYRYVQVSGYNNSLGLVKFNFPNKHSVYLHDTNHRDYFSREYRALSSGCVRVENPLVLAEKILSNEDKEWTSKEVDTIISKKNIKTVPIKNNINVYLLYWTNWLDKDGLQFREDIYNLDKNLYTALRN
ncbi:Peptidoglycan-binding protein [Flavobacterium sp. 9AF]|uniref:L,D-transpeptidase family protein n=1 Tax=Flavobacterium sp. 9AF TaxID=2653142 RepID=UPI0012F171CB|nr:L,D-transpeptidase family protein [Flavobacterium sp. 9AF]VXB11319.1 Peptidoglycan-binding protein [Flavobacterium sp. 9AF]